MTETHRAPLEGVSIVPGTDGDMDTITISWDPRGARVEDIALALHVAAYGICAEVPGA